MGPWHPYQHFSGFEVLELDCPDASHKRIEMKGQPNKCAAQFLLNVDIIETLIHFTVVVHCMIEEAL
jgi:hypothetical protein